MFNHRIPNEFSRSDKIGPFTFAQLGVLGAGAMILLMLLMMTSNLWILLMAFTVMVPLTGGMMFIRVNKLPVYEFLFKYVIYMATPRLLVFRSDNIKRFDLEDELVGFEERTIAGNTVKSIKKDNKKTSKSSVRKDKVQTASKNKKSSAKVNNKVKHK